MLDIIILSLLVVIMGEIKTRDSLVITICAAVSVLYSNMQIWESHPAWINHIVVTLAFIPALILVTTSAVFFSVLAFALLHFFTSIEYGVFDSSDFFISNFAYYSSALYFCIMVALCYDRHNYDYSKTAQLGNSWIINLCRHYIQTFRASKRKKGQKSQC